MPSFTSRLPARSGSRTYDIGIDQNILGEKLIFKLGYFHNIFDHQLEGVGTGALEQIFGFSPEVAQNLFTPYVNSLAFRAQGIETEVQYQPFQHLFVRGAYTYLDAVVIHSFSSDAYNDGQYNPNPNLPGIPHWSRRPVGWSTSFPPSTAHRLLRGAVHRQPLVRCFQGSARQPLGRLHLPRRLRL